MVVVDLSDNDVVVLDNDDRGTLGVAAEEVDVVYSDTGITPSNSLSTQNSRLSTSTSASSSTSTPTGHRASQRRKSSEAREELERERDFLNQHALQTYDERNWKLGSETRVQLDLGKVTALYARVRYLRSRVQQQGPFPQGCKVDADLWQACGKHLTQIADLEDGAKLAESLDAALRDTDKDMEKYSAIQNRIRGRNAKEAGSGSPKQKHTDICDIDIEDDDNDGAPQADHDAARTKKGKAPSKRIPRAAGRDQSVSPVVKDRREADHLKALVKERRKLRNEVLVRLRDVIESNRSDFDRIDAMASKLEEATEQLRRLGAALSDAAKTVPGKAANLPRDIQTSSFRGCLELSRWVLRQKRSWDSQNDFEALRRKSEELVDAARKQEGSLGALMFASDPTRAPPEVSTLLRDLDVVLDAELTALKKVVIGNGMLDSMPLESMRDAINRIETYCAALLARASKLRTNWDTKEKEIRSFEEASSSRYSLDVIKSLNKELRTLNHAIYEQQRVVEDLELDERHEIHASQSDEESDAEDEANEEGQPAGSPRKRARSQSSSSAAGKKNPQEHLKEQRQALSDLKEDAQKKLDGLITQILEERQRLVDQAAKHFPELLLDAGWIRVLDEICKPDSFPLLDWAPFRERLPLSLLISARNCDICSETTPLDEGIRCEEGHFMCNNCVESHVRVISQVGNDSRLRDAKGEIPCYDPSCKAPPIPSADVLKFVSKDTLMLFLAAVKRSVEEDTVTTMQSEMERKRKRMEQEIQLAGSHNAKVERHFTHIVDNILTLKCPQGGHAFSEFTGCFALTCTRCRPKSTFCGWCLTDTGADAHAHVAYCAANLSNSANRNSARNFANGRMRGAPTGYYGTKEMFEEAQRKRRKRLLETYWTDYVKADPPEVQADLAKRLTPELIGDLGKVRLPVTRVPKSKKTRTTTTASTSSSSSGAGGSVEAVTLEPELICVD